MRIGIDARMMQKGLGIGRYIERLLSHLQEIDDSNEYVVFLNNENWDAFNPVKSNWKKSRADIKWYSLREQLVFPRLIAREKVDIMHFPHMNVPLMYRTPFVVTVHDIILIKHPQSATTAASTKNKLVHWLKYHGYHMVLRHALKASRSVITVSEYVKHDIITMFAVPEDKVHVTYEAADLVPLERSIASLPSTVHEPYLLYVGSAYPHKNVEALLDVMECAGKQQLPYTLVMTGQEDFFQKRLVERITSRFPDKKVIHLGCVNDAVLATLYRQAFAYIFPSFEEGFGLPALEALGYGTPVIASNSSCLPEIIGSAGLYFNPTDSKEACDQIMKIHNNPLLRSELVEKGKLRWSQFSWDRCAHQTLAIYTI